MSRHHPGDRVRVVSVTPEAGHAPITTPNHPDALDWNGETLIGKTGTVLDVFGDRHSRNNIRLDHLVEAVAFPDADLEPEA